MFTMMNRLYLKQIQKNKITEKQKQITGNQIRKYIA